MNHPKEREEKYRSFEYCMRPGLDGTVRNGGYEDQCQQTNENELIEKPGNPNSCGNVTFFM